MTDSQKLVFNWLAHQRDGSSSWYRPSQIHPDGYKGAIGKVLRTLVELGHVEVRSADRGNGTTCVEYRSCISYSKRRKAESV